MRDQLAWLDAAEVVRPGDLQEAREMVVQGAGDGGRGPGGRASALLVRGSGTKLAWGHPAERVDRVIDTGGLDRLIAHEPGDMTATVQAGMSLATLRIELAREGQELAIDPPLGPPLGPPAAPPAGEEQGRSATLGGIFACNDSGPRRLRYGSLRELVIGATVILADGTVARSGGKVIKNVAGYDLCKLFCGAFGTLGLVAELTVRLHPIPERTCSLRAPVDARGATDLGLALMASPLEPAAVDHDGETLWLRFEGSEAQADEQRVRAREFIVRRGLDCQLVRDDEQDGQWAALSEAGAGRPGETVLRIATLPGQLAALADTVADLRDRGRDRGLAMTMTSQVCLGLHTVRIGHGDAASHVEIARGLRARAIELGGHAVIRQAGQGLQPGEQEPSENRLDPFGPPPSSFPVMRRIKQQFDPERRFSPGRFVGGL